MPQLAKIFIYPLKSLEPVSLQQVRILKSGALEGDRQYAMQDPDGKFVNGKRFARIHLLRSAFDPFSGFLQLGRAQTGLTARYHIENDRPAIEAWLFEFFNMPITLKRNTESGFPDDPDCLGPTVISTATLNEVSRWFPPLDTQQIRLRIRANLEITHVPAFWEDHLYGLKPQRVRFRIGQCFIEGNNPCQRCAVPPRDPHTSELYPNFTKIFGQQREKTLPPWAERSRFNHFYRLSTNTVVREDQAGRSLTVGDDVEILGPA